LQVVGTRSGLLFLSLLQNLKTLGNDKTEVIWENIEKLVFATVKFSSNIEHNHDHKTLEDMTAKIDEVLQSYYLTSQTVTVEGTPENEDTSASKTGIPPPAPLFMMGREDIDPNQNPTLTAAFKFKPNAKMRTLNWEKLKKVDTLNKESIWKECAYLSPFLVLNEKDIVDHFCADKCHTLTAAPQTSKVSYYDNIIKFVLYE